MEFDDYESLPCGNMKIHMIAGAVAGILEHCVMYPVDNVKTRMQLLTPSPEATYHNVKDGLVKLFTIDGTSKALRGITAMVWGAGPAHAMYFAAYEGIRAKYDVKSSFQKHVVNASAGCVATFLHDAVMVPSEVVKQRMQVFNSPYKSCFDCMCKLYCQEGIKAFYRSYTTQMLMNIPFHSSHIVIYEKLSHSMNPNREYNPKVHIIAGAGAGAFASAITTPLDVCKTVLNLQEQSALTHIKGRRLNGFRSALKTIYSMHGLSGFFRGMQARILYQMPGTAISWSVYEFFKHILYKADRGDLFFNSEDSDLDPLRSPDGPNYPSSSHSPHTSTSSSSQRTDCVQRSNFEPGPSSGLFNHPDLYNIRPNSNLN